MAPVVKTLSAVAGVQSLVCVTAQHRQMLDQVLDLFGIRPDIDLNLMQPDQSLAQLTSEIFRTLDPVLAQVRPDWVLVQGDTTTVMAAGLLAYYHRIRLGHVEAGLRTGDKWQPFPEEVNRRVTGVVADLHFAPTETSRKNLLKEGIEERRIHVTGNTVVDALYDILKLEAPPVTQALLSELGILSHDRMLVLVTAHRRENFGKPLEDICQAIRKLAERYHHRVQFLYPVHLNPNVQEPVNRLLAGIENVHRLPPQDYLPMVHLMRNAKLILTDSGGIQEEATALGVPTLVMRRVTERPEGVEAGSLMLVGTDPQKIYAETCRLLDHERDYQLMARAKNPYGDGHSAGRIVDLLLADADANQEVH